MIILNASCVLLAIWTYDAFHDIDIVLFFFIKLLPSPPKAKTTWNESQRPMQIAE